MAFADKPHHGDCVINTHTPLGSDPERVWSLAESSENGSGELVNLGSATRTDPASDTYSLSYWKWVNDGYYKQTAIDVWDSAEGGGINLSHYDRYLNIAPPSAALETYTTGHIRLRVSFAAMPTGATYTPILYSGKGSPTNAQFNQGFLIGVNATHVNLVRRNSSGTTTNYSVAHATSGVVAGTAFDIDFSWGSGGVKLFVNGVGASNNGADTEATVIRPGSPGTDGVMISTRYSAVAGYTNDTAFTLLAASWTDAQLSDADITSIREDPHWPVRSLAPFQTIRPAVAGHAIGSGQVLVSMIITQGNAIICRIVEHGTNEDLSNQSTYFESTGLESENPFAFVVSESLSGTKQLCWEWQTANETWYKLYPTSCSDGKACGVPVINAVDLRQDSAVLIAIGDQHLNMDLTTFEDHLGSDLYGGAGFSDNTAIEEFRDLTTKIVADEPSLIVQLGDLLYRAGMRAAQGATDADKRAYSERVDRISRNIQSDLYTAAITQDVLGNHEGTFSTLPVGSITVGKLRFDDCLRYRPTARLSELLASEDPIHFGATESGPVDVFWLDPLDTLGSIETPGDQLYELDAWAAASTKPYKVICRHSTRNNGGGRGGVDGTLSDDALDVHNLCVNRGIDLVLTAHNHIAYVGERDGVCYVTAPSTPWYLSPSDLEQNPTTYSGPYSKFVELMAGYVKVSFGEQMVVEIIRTGRFADGEVILGLRQVAFRWPRVRASRQLSISSMGIGL